MLNMKLVNIALRLTCEGDPYEDYPELMGEYDDCYMVREVATNVHWHMYLYQYTIETLRTRLKRRFPGEGNARYSVTVVKDDLDYLSYISKDGDVRKNYDCFDVEWLRAYHWSKVDATKQRSSRSKARSLGIREELLDRCSVMNPSSNGELTSRQIFNSIMNIYKDRNLLPPSDFYCVQLIEYVYMNRTGDSSFLKNKFLRVAHKLSPPNPSFFSDFDVV